mgnify:FL=1
MFDVLKYKENLAKDRNYSLTVDEQEMLVNELVRNRKYLAHLAHCHAATLSSLPKSASKSSRKRLASICRTAVTMLKDQCHEPGLYLDRQGYLEHAIKACREAAETSDC